MRFEVWRRNKDKELHLFCGDGADAFGVAPLIPLSAA
jgi:hypothetical protein